CRPHLEGTRGARWLTVDVDARLWAPRRPHAGARLCRDARGSDGGIREELAAGILKALAARRLDRQRDRLAVLRIFGELLEKVDAVTILQVHLVDGDLPRLVAHLRESISLARAWMTLTATTIAAAMAIVRGYVLHKLNPIASRLRPSGFAC